MGNNNNRGQKKPKQQNGKPTCQTQAQRKTNESTIQKDVIKKEIPEKTEKSDGLSAENKKNRILKNIQNIIIYCGEIVSYFLFVIAAFIKAPQYALGALLIILLLILFSLCIEIEAPKDEQTVSIWTPIKQGVFVYGRFMKDILQNVIPLLLALLLLKNISTDSKVNEFIEANGALGLYFLITIGVLFLIALVSVLASVIIYYTKRAFRKNSCEKTSRDKTTKRLHIKQKEKKKENMKDASVEVSAGNDNLQMDTDKNVTENVSQEFLQTQWTRFSAYEEKLILETEKTFTIAIGILGVAGVAAVLKPENPFLNVKAQTLTFAFSCLIHSGLIVLIWYQAYKLRLLHLIKAYLMTLENQMTKEQNLSWYNYYDRKYMSRNCAINSFLWVPIIPCAFIVFAGCGYLEWKNFLIAGNEKLVLFILIQIVFAALLIVPIISISRNGHIRNMICKEPNNVKEKIAK